MTTWLVTRHPGAMQWAKDNGIEVDDRTICSDLDIGEVRAGDLVVGTLPVHLVAEINERGARYLHLSLKVPEGARGRELSAEEMCRFGGRLEELAAVEMEALCLDAGIPLGHWAAGLKIRPENASPAPNLPLNELDLVVVWRNRLLIVECKTGMQAGDSNESMNIANKLKAIRDYLGGPFSSMWLASAQEVPPGSMAAERCRLAGVQIVHHARLNQMRDFLAGWMRLGESHGARTDWASAPRRNR